MSTLFERLSSKENLKLAYKYVQGELTRSTLAINPVDHPAVTAIDALGEQFFAALERYLRDGNYSPEKGFFVYIPKDNLGLRPVCLLSMIDRIVYQAIFNQNILGYKIDGQLSDKMCFSYRVNDKDGSDYFLHYSKGWDAYCRAQAKAFHKGFVWKTEIDVQQYYEHIPIGKLIESLEKDFGIKDQQILSLLKTQLCTWVEYPDLPKGIPQGQNASSILGNAYLSSLDKFAEDTLVSKKLQYFRYVDDIILMGKTKEDVLKATEKIARFLRSYNLNLNEKTSVTKLSDTDAIDALRILPEYAETTVEIPKDELSLIKERVPGIVEAILHGKDVSKMQLRDIKYYLRVGTDYDPRFILNLIAIIPLRPSLIIPIIQYVTEGRARLLSYGNLRITKSIDVALWHIYSNSENSEWLKFWILKLLVSSESVTIASLGREVRRILGSPETTIFKIVSFYYETIHGRALDIGEVNRAIQITENSVEKSLSSFFLLNAFSDARPSTIRSSIERTLNSPSQEMNLIGCFLFQSKPQIKIEVTEENFSAYILGKRLARKRTKAAKQTPKSDYYLVRRDALISIDSPASVLGVARPKRTKETVNLLFPEPVVWEKVMLKMKTGLREMEIYYNNRFIETADYVQLGFFTGKKAEKQDRQWNFLCALSVLSATDITQATASNMRRMVAKDSQTTVSTGNVHQIKRTLVKRLRALFKTEDDPFYERRGYYAPRFKVLPETELRRDTLRKQGGRLNENLLSADDNEAL